MIVYIPYYDGQKRILKVETKKCIYWKNRYYDANIIYGNMIYNGEHIFRTEENCKDYWNKLITNDLINPKDCEWKEYRLIE